MSNPTREEAEQYLADCRDEDYEAHKTFFHRLIQAYIRALDMRDGIAQILESEIGPWYKPKEMKRVIQHFDEGGA